MNTWYYGYGSKKGLTFLREDQETIATELFYDEGVKKEISDEKKKELWGLSNQAHNESSELGVVFKLYFPDADKEELLALKESDPVKAMAFIESKGIHIELGTHGTTLEEAKRKFFTICGVEQEIVKEETTNA